jgi:hypothetical protein
MPEFRRERERIVAQLAEEGARLDAFLDVIVRANEPSISHTEAALPELDAIRRHACTGTDDPEFRLLATRKYAR